MPSPAPKSTPVIDLEDKDVDHDERVHDDGRATLARSDGEDPDTHMAEAAANDAITKAESSQKRSSA